MWLNLLDSKNIDRKHGMALWTNNVQALEKARARRQLGTKVKKSMTTLKEIQDLVPKISEAVHVGDFH